jgi:hypothetical protein
VDARRSLDEIGKPWEELDITQLLEKYIPLDRRYLVDRLVRLLHGIED